MKGGSSDCRTGHSLMPGIVRGPWYSRKSEREQAIMGIEYMAAQIGRTMVTIRLGIASLDRR